MGYGIMTDSLYTALLGALVMACFVASLFFLRFWKTTKDRFFLYFAVSFFIQGISRLMMVFGDYASENEPFVYSVRLASFLIILFAIVDKNRIKMKSAESKKTIK
jgi:hypothetical protein